MNPADLAEVPFDDAPVRGPSGPVNGHEESFEDSHPVQRPLVSSGSVAVGRTLPHSLEAEEYLLSCCLLDGSDVVSRSMEARIKPESFYDPKHGIIFEKLVDLHTRQTPIDISIVAEELKTSRQLDQIGGYAFLAQVSSRIPTTAQAAYFIEKVREQALLREIVRSATGTVEDCYNFTGGIDEFVADIQRRTTHLAEIGSAGSVAAEFTSRRAGVGRPIRQEVAVLFLRDIAVANRSNLGLLTALQKAGKSSTVGAIMGAFMADPDHKKDLLGFRAVNPSGHALVHLDTEQSPQDHEGLVATALVRAGRDKIPEWIYSYGVKGISAEVLRQKYRKLMRELYKRHGGICMSILDGAAEFVADPNDPRECNPFVTELEAISTDYDCHILNVLHLNPSPQNQATKSRGHLGSQLERKCETDLRLVKDQNGVTTIYTACARHAPIFEKDGPRFSWDSQDGMHLTSMVVSSPRGDAKREKLRELAEEIFSRADAKNMRFSDFVKAISEAAKIGISAAEDKFSGMKKMGVIQRDGFGYWSIVT